MWNAAQIDEELQQRDGTIRKTQTKMLVGKSVVTERRMPLTGLSVNSTQLRKEAMNLKVNRTYTN